MHTLCGRRHFLCPARARAPSVLPPPSGTPAPDTAEIRVDGSAVAIARPHPQPRTRVRDRPPPPAAGDARARTAGQPPRGPMRAWRGRILANRAALGPDVCVTSNGYNQQGVYD